MVSAPKIDNRTRQQLMMALRHYAMLYSGWEGADDIDMGETLMALFSYMAEDVQVRLNQVPDKNFLAFLNLIGVTAIPPQPARVPLTFSLAEGSREGTFVPAWTQASAATDTGEIIYETAESIYLSATQIDAVYTRDPDNDQYTDHSQAVLGGNPQIFSAFAGDMPIPHMLYIAHDGLLGRPAGKRLTITFESMDAPKLDALPIVWSYWDGEFWQPIDVTDGLVAHYLWQVTIEDCPQFMPIVINGIEACWLRAELTLPLAPQQISGESIMPLTERVLELGAFAPFYRKKRFPLLIHLKTTDDEVEQITMDIKLSKAGTPTDKLVLAWEYWDGEKWAEIARTGAGLSDDEIYSNFTDTTDAFAQDGVVSFDLPVNWSQVHDGGWLRVSVKAGSYGRTKESVYPEIKSLVGDYVWMLRDLPFVERVLLSIESETNDILPEIAYSGIAPLDLSADALPFGAEPTFNSQLIIGSSEAFADPNAQVTLKIGVTNPANSTTTDPLMPTKPSPYLVIAWEMWNGKTWAQIGLSTPDNLSAGANTYQFRDTTYCFTQSGEVSFVVPWGIAQTSLANGDEGHWLRARIVRGNYGLPQQYIQSGGQYTMIEATFQPPAINSVTIDKVYTPDAPTEHCLGYNDFHFRDFTADTMTTGATFTPFYRSEDVSSALYFAVSSTSSENTLPFQNAPVTFFFDVDGDFTREEFDKIATNSNLDDRPQVVWEYYSSDGWRQLEARDTTNHLTLRGTVSFIGASDFVPSSEFGHFGHWIRVRWVQGTYRVLPRLRRVLLNTTWGLQGERTVNQILGSSTGDSHQQFMIEADSTILAGQMVEVQHDDGWHVWQEVSDFYSSNLDDRHYTLNRVTGEIQFGNGNYGAVPPIGANNIRVTYRVGGSRAGNVSAGLITQLKTTVPRVAGVINHISAQGGDKQESLARTKKRGPTVLRHRNRAVAAQDYVDLAYEISAVKRAIVITPERGTSVGQIGLVIVPDSSSPQPVPSLGLIEQVREKVLRAAPPTVDVWVTSPDWIQVSVTVEFVPRSFDLAVATKYSIMRRLEQFLHPLQGYEGNGWAFGRKPQESDVFAALDAMAGVDHIRYLKLHYSWDDDPRPNRFLIFSGVHQVEIVGEKV